MCLACCDPEKLAKVAPPEKPNSSNIPASGSIDIETRSDAIIKVTSVGHYAGSVLVVEPLTSAQQQCTYRRQGSASAFIPGPGKWRVYNKGLSSIQVNVFTLYCGAAFKAFDLTGYASPTHSTITLDSTPASTIVLAANPDRAYALFVNDSDTVMYLSFGPAAVANAGIRLNANGGSYELEGNTLWRGVVNAILASAGSAKQLLVTEGV
jgi:hypothetical protein